MHMTGFGCSCNAILSFIIMAIISKPISAGFIPENCGKVKILTEKQGIIQTPNFPTAFPVPARCRWVIDGSLYQDSTIYVYFTQLFVTAGLSISEYPYYESENNEGLYGREIFNTADDVLRYEFFRTNYSYLVIDLQLNVLEGNHLRVLYHLLDVYGFNITYEITKNGPREERCTVSDCSLVGHCYANYDFTSYRCSCFQGFFGKNCGYGPLCKPDKNSCANGAICRYAGETIVICECTEGYTGSKCDIPVFKMPRSDCLNSMECTVQCPYDEKRNSIDSPCECDNNQTAREKPDLIRYLLTFGVANLSTVIETSLTSNLQRSSDLEEQHSTLEYRILHEIERYLRKVRLLQLEDLHLLNITKETNLTLNVTLRFSAGKNDSIKIKEAGKQMIDKGIIANSYFAIKQLPLLHLLKVSTNMEDNSVLEGKEIIVSCKAQGSPNISFRWFKDGIPINVSIAVRGMWSNIVLFELENYTSMLRIEHADILDTGIYTCQVEDFAGYQQCRSIIVSVLEGPHVKLKPMSITVEKGQNVSIKCLSTNGFYNGTKFGYTWLQNDNLIKAVIPIIYWEDLYRGGSILYVNNVQRSGIFKCNVHAIGDSEGAVRIDILNKNDHPFCERDGVWPITGGGVTALQECPNNYSGHAVSRLCLMIDTHIAQWQLPDYSLCISNRFLLTTKDFHRLTLGYENKSVTTMNTLHSLRSILNMEHGNKLLPGEGESYMMFLRTVLKFLIQAKKYQDVSSCANHFFNITDTLLRESNSILNIKAIFTLSEIIEKWTYLWILHSQNQSYTITHFDNFSTNNSVSSVNFKSFKLFLPGKFGQVLKLDSDVTIKFQSLLHNVNKLNQSSESVVIVYRNLSELLTSRYVSGSWQEKDVLFELKSTLIHVLQANNYNSEKGKTSDLFWYELQFQLPFDRVHATRWGVCCASLAGFGQNWKLTKCNHTFPLKQIIQCFYTQPGILAIFATQLPIEDSGPSRKYHFVVLSACLLCFIQCMIVFCILLPRWYKFRSCLIYLKLQVCLSTGSAMLLFVYASCEPSFVSYAYILSSLQICLLTSISSHISILIVIYIDIFALKEIPKIKISAISVMTMSPMLLTVFAPLSRQITDEKLTCWWLRYNTMLLYIHLVIGLFLLLLFIFLYYSVMSKLWFLLPSTKSGHNRIVQRICLVQYTFLLFFCATAMVAASIVHVNQNTPFAQFAFSFASVLLGFLFVVCYIPKNKSIFRSKLCPKLRYNEKQNGKYSPELQIISSTQLGNFARRSENHISTLPSSQLEFTCEQNSFHVQQQFIPSENLNSSDFKTNINSLAVFNHDLITDCAKKNAYDCDSSSKVNENVSSTDQIQTKNLTLQDGSPDVILLAKKNNISPTICVNSVQSSTYCDDNQREILTRVCVELGVIKPSNENFSSGNENSALLICSVDVEPYPGHTVEVNEVKITTMNIDEGTTSSAMAEDNQIVENGSEKLLCNESSTEGDVLNRISQDLDYLLNRKCQKLNISPSDKSRDSLNQTSHKENISHKHNNNSNINVDIFKTN